MKRTKILVSVIVVTALAMGAVAADKPAKDKPAELSAELKVLDRFLGNWQGTMVAHKTRWNPKETRGTGTISCVRVLGGRFTQTNTAAAGGSTSIALTTYDERLRRYRIWWFYSQGHMKEFEGHWNAETKTFTWKSVDGDTVTTVTKVQHPNSTTRKWDAVGKNASGEIVFHVEGKSKRVKQLPKPKATPAAKPAERSAEQKVLDFLAGDWKTTFTPAKSPENPKPVSQTATQSVVRVLDGRFILQNEKASWLTLTTYDMRRKCYRMWFFHSNGFTSEYTGKWDAKTRTLTWLSDQGNGGTSGFKIQYPDDNTIKWSFVAKDPDGKAVSQTKGKWTRVK